MSTQESLRLPDGIELAHPTLSHPGRLVRLLCAVVSILRRVVNGLWDHVPMRYTITSQFIGNDLPGLSAVTAQ